MPPARSCRRGSVSESSSDERWSVGELLSFAPDSAAWREAPPLTSGCVVGQAERAIGLLLAFHRTPDVDAFVEQLHIDRLGHSAQGKRRGEGTPFERRPSRRVVSRSAVLGEVPEGDWSADFGGFGADAGVEVLAPQAVAVAFQREDL